MRELEACLPPELVELSPAIRQIAYGRRLAAAACGVVVLDLVRDSGFPGASAGEPRALAEVYQQMRTGALNLATAERQVAFGLALLAESRALR